MERLFSGKVWKLPNDVDTDTIIPGRYGVIIDKKEMGTHCLEPLRPEFASQVQPGDIIVAGSNFGCGSSREMAAEAINVNGVFCIIAKSFARIFYRNAINNGMILIESDEIPDACEEGDILTVEVNKEVRVNGKSFPIPNIPDNLFEIIEAGGLIPSTIEKMEKAEELDEPVSSAAPASMRTSFEKPHTLAEKILLHNSDASDDLKPGDIVVVEPQRYMVHDIYTSFLKRALNDMHVTKAQHPERIVMVFDHLLPTNQAATDYIHFRDGLELCDRFHVQNVLKGRGISHSLMHEMGFARPGEIAIATDSHATTYGGAGCFSTGIGHTEMASVWATGSIWFKTPSAIKFVLKGEFPEGVGPKDLILKILGDIRADGGQYKSLEFTGPAAHAMSMDERFCVANMALEAGAKVALFEADEKTAAYYGMDLDDIAWIHCDDDATYECVLEYDVSELSPQLSCPQGVDNVHPIEEVKGTKLNEVYIGSCTNGSIEDMEAAAKVLKGKHANPYTKLVVIPATSAVYKEALHRGYIQTFLDAGAMVTHPCCGLCCGQPYGLMSDDEVVLGTNNRNFIGRMGTKKSLIYLSSPTVAAASAIAGEIVDPREMLA